MQRVHLLMDNPSGPNHRCITRSFNWDLPGWGMAVFQSHIAETGVHSTVGRILAGLVTFPLQPSNFSMIDVAALYMHHVTVEGVRLPGDQKLAPHGWTSIPWGHGSMESIPVCEIFFFRDEVESGCPDYYTFGMMTFIVESHLVPFVGYHIGIWSILLAHFVSDIAYPIFPLPEHL